MDERLAQRARTPRYTIAEAGPLVGRPAATVRRWSVGHRRRYNDALKEDAPLIVLDGDPSEGGMVLSFLNLLELRVLSSYRDEAALQAIRRALDYAGKQLKEPRPLISRRFHVHGGELFTKFAETKDGRQLLVNASRHGQTILQTLIENSRAVTSDLDYEKETAYRWWYRSREEPIIVDTRVAAGHPITAETGVRIDAITSRSSSGYTPEEIERDTGATTQEVDSVLRLAA
ncbi:MAG: hypothetical protein ACRDK4_02685 [Solirubrobacteraceae bacterium]